MLSAGPNILLKFMIYSSFQIHGLMEYAYADRISETDIFPV